MTLPSMPVCTACGSQWRGHDLRCEVCGDPSGTRRDARPDATIAWVRVTATFPCRSCGQRSPLDSFDVDGSVTCTGCGLAQAYHVPVWDELLVEAHGLADLGFPAPYGRAGANEWLSQTQNPYAGAGHAHVRFRVERAALITVGGVVRTASLTADYNLGVPLCEGCKEPIEAHTDDRSLRTRCTRCGDDRTYARPHTNLGLRHAPFAVLAAEARTDAPEARSVDDAGGAVAIKCPSCGAGLDAQLDTPIVRCGYCRTTCRVPSRTLHLLRPGIVPPRPFWLAFRGPSARRTELEAAGRQYLADREATSSIEALAAPSLTAEQIRGKLLVTTVLLVLVGLAFVPTVIERVEAGRSGASAK